MEINDVPVVVDFRVHRDAMVWPMVAAGTSNDDIKYARDLAPEFDEDELLMTHTHTLSVLVENKPGVLARIAGLFSRRGFNIDSLAVGPTEHPEISRMTIVVNVEDSPLEQVTKQLNKLVEVIKIVELDGRRRRSTASCCWSRSRPTPRPAARCSTPSSSSGPRSSTSPPTRSPSR